MPILQLEQGSKEWLEFRRTHIMATHASIIMGSNHFSSMKDLWDEMLGIKPPKEDNEAMRRGRDLEPEARKVANKLIGFIFEPCVYQSDKFHWAAASLDGMYGNKILEIKCPKERTHLDALENRVIPYYYQDQIQHQLMCTGAEVCYYFSYRPECKKGEYVVIPVLPDLERIERIIIKEQDFYINHLCSMCPPEKEWIFVPK